MTTITNLAYFFNSQLIEGDEMSTDESQRYLVMTPGPVQVPQEALQELARPMIHHRTPEFEKILTRVLEKLSKVFMTDQPVFIQAATGSGGMESALVNVLSPGDKVISVICGKFGERWAEMAKTFGAEVLPLNVPWGESAKAKEIEELLKKNPDTRAVLIQACETSTAILNPIEEVSKVVARFPKTLLIVDAITALGQIPLPMDKWGLDVVVGASQKAFMLPTGLAFLSFSKKAWPFVESAKCPRYYWDIRKEKKANLARQTFFSSAVSHIRALDKVLDRILALGIEKNIHVFSAYAEATREGGRALGLVPYAKTPSTSVTALALPAGVDGEKLRDQMESKYLVTIAGGQDQIKGKVIRIGTMGDIGPKDILHTIVCLARALKDLGFNCDEGAAKKAAESVFTKQGIKF